MSDPGYARLRSLDGLRGVAASAVLLFHVSLALGGWPGIPFLGAFWNGHNAVLLFFVLSGLALSLSYWRRQEDAWLPFLIRRVFRLYPAFAVSVLVEPALLPIAGAVGRAWRPIPGGIELLTCIARLGDPSNFSTWTLAHEMRISVVFPGLIWFMRVAGYRAVPIAAAISLLGPALGGDTTPLTVSDWSLTVYYAWLFVLGAEIARHEGAVRAWLGNHRPMAWGLAAFGLLVSSYSYVESPFGISTAFPFEIAAGALAVCAIGIPRLVAWLEAPLPQWLGRISYSLYLLHIPLITATVSLSVGLLPKWAGLALGVAISFAAAELSFRWIEQPMMRLGRRVAVRLQPRLAHDQL